MSSPSQISAMIDSSSFANAANVSHNSTLRSVASRLIVNSNICYYQFSQTKESIPITLDPRSWTTTQSSHRVNLQRHSELVANTISTPLSSPHQFPIDHTSRPAVQYSHSLGREGINSPHNTESPQKSSPNFDEIVYSVVDLTHPAKTIYPPQHYNSFPLPTTPLNP